MRSDASAGSAINETAHVISLSNELAASGFSLDLKLYVRVYYSGMQGGTAEEAFALTPGANDEYSGPRLPVRIDLTQFTHRIVPLFYRGGVVMPLDHYSADSLRQQWSSLGTAELPWPL